MYNKYLPCILIVSFTLVSCANIFDLLSNSEIEQREEPDKQSCSCSGPNCMCCVDFNFTYVDLGGPGCVQMKYLSQDEGISLNVSFGKKVLHAQEVKGPNPAPICMTLLRNIAEICARFSTLEKSNDGLKGCLVLEPKVLHDIQTQFDIGCFTTGKDGMKIDENATTTIEDISNEDNTENTTESEAGPDNEEFSEEAIFAAVSETAQKGLAFFSNFLGIDFSNLGGGNKTSTEVSSQEDNEATEAV